MEKPHGILAFGGSLRIGSYNQKLVKAAAAGAAEKVPVTVIALRDYPLPLFDEDLESESGMPENAAKLKALFLSHSGLLISSPEYNGSISATLKNVIDWVSRTTSDNEKPLSAFSGKAAAIMGASPGGLGGVRGLVHLRAILAGIGVHMLPDQMTLSSAHEAFDSNGNLTQERQLKKASALGAALADLVLRLRD